MHKAFWRLCRWVANSHRMCPRCGYVLYRDWLASVGMCLGCYRVQSGWQPAVYPFADYSEVHNGR